MTENSFQRLSKRNKRIFVAKDVLQRLDIGFYVPLNMSYIAAEDLDYQGKYLEESAKSILQKMERENKECPVCAKGALVCSYIRNFNRYTVLQMQNTVEENAELIAIFGQKLWTVIEALFEGWMFTLEGDFEICTRGRTANYLYRHEQYQQTVYNKKFRKWTMKSIMENIVRNNGALNYSGVIID